jgi:predicted nucleic acid-binding protein
LALTHPCVIGELACGAIVNRARVLDALAALPRATPATNEETLHLLQERRLWGRGVGWVDVQLLASALLSNCHLWTFNQRLALAAREAGVKQFRPAPVQ